MSPEEFRRVRKAARMTQAQMAARLGKSRKTINNWEAGIHEIPNDALDTLTERGIAPTAEPMKRVSPATHPEFYDPGKVKYGFSRNIKHPHWFAQFTPLRHYLPQATRDVFDALICYPDDIDKLKWTPESAIRFIENFGLSNQLARELAFTAGFAVHVERDPYLVAQQEYFREHPLATVDEFLNARPEFKPQQPESHGEPDPKLVKLMNDAFFNQTTNNQE
jgi:transcriptional regulator with XRE-family HTH domain